MVDTALSRFFEPERIVVLSRDPAGDGPSPAPGVEIPGIDVRTVGVDDIGGSEISPETLVIPDLPRQALPSILDDLSRTDLEAVLLPGSLPEQPPAGESARDPGVEDSEEAWSDIQTAVESADYRVMGPEASIRVAEEFTSSPGTTASAGQMAILAESPAVGTCLAERAGQSGGDVGLVVGVGAEIDVKFGEIAGWAAERPETDLVLGRAGVLGSRFVEAIRATDTRTPIAVTGEYGPDVTAGSRAAIQGRAVTETIIEQAGGVAVDSLEGIMQSAPALAGQPTPDPESVVVVSNAGGPGVMGIDAVGTSGLEVARLEPETVERVEAAIPDHGSAQNPLDLVADSDVEVFETVIAAVLEDENVGSAVVMSAPNPIVDFEDLAEVVVGASQRYTAPLVTVLMGGERTRKPEAILEQAGIPNYFDPYRAVVALDLLRQQEAMLPNRNRGIERPESLRLDSLEEAVAETGGELKGDAARAFVADLGAAVRRQRPDTGLEVVIQARHSRERGPLVVTGIAEFAGAVGDLAFRTAPLTRADARDMLQELQGAPVFEGARGRDPVAVQPIVDTLVGLSHFIASTETVDRISLPGTLATESGLVTPRVSLGRSESRRNPMPPG